jgi:hypothetical protein
MAYATYQDVQDRMLRTLSSDEQALATTLLDDAAVMIDATHTKADNGTKKIVSCRMVIRAIGSGNDTDIPIGATQGSMSGLGYTQSWTMGTGTSVGELYISSSERKMLGLGNQIGSHSPTEELAEVPV